ncbi:MAG: peptide chain release factor N(5)-glutamine methyltransferase [Proteobacteria bacterium]|nr:peptide chain release factor N(5)-glutamine methyltransferase [Pseudomonadota bacterium]
MTRPLTVGVALRDARHRLASAGADSPGLDARLLVERALDGAGLSLHRERALKGEERDRLAALVARRARREPMSHILGVREFWSLPFKVTADTLTPRPDSETVVEAALAGGPGKRVLDLGTGTGCLLLSLLREWPEASGLGVDISAAALFVARHNARALGLEDRALFVAGDWGAALGGCFDVIVANPPYIPDGDLETLAPEVSAFEPRIALAGGGDGLDAFRALGPDLPGLLLGDGRACLEVGMGQAPRVRGILEACGMRVLGVARDLAAIERCVTAVKG